MKSLRSLHTNSITDSSWATWPLVIGIVIPIIGLTVLFTLWTIYYFRHCQQLRSTGGRDLVYYKCSELERSSQSSGSLTQQAGSPACLQAKPPRPVRPPRPCMNTDECLRIISKSRLETIRESTRTSMDCPAVSSAPTSLTSDNTEMDTTSLRSAHARQLLGGGQPPGILSPCHNYSRHVQTKARGTSHLRHPASLRPLTQIMPEDAFELQQLRPPFRLQRENWTYDRTAEGSRRHMPAHV